jgi:DNA-binding transcriptional ArsR family regulator
LCFDSLGFVSEAAFHALADPRRRAILRLVRDQPRSVNEIAGQFDVTQQAISLHLKVLRDAGLVAVRPDGQRRRYVLRPEGLAALRDFLAEFWPGQLQRPKGAAEPEQPIAEPGDGF